MSIYHGHTIRTVRNNVKQNVERRLEVGVLIERSVSFLKHSWALAAVFTVCGD
jgi:hypothetical protein